MLGGGVYTPVASTCGPWSMSGELGLAGRDASFVHRYGLRRRTEIWYLVLFCAFEFIGEDWGDVG